MRNTATILFCVVSFTVTTSIAFSQKRERVVSIAGCYSDLREQNGNIIGNGVIEISQVKGKYVGTYSELTNELGLTKEPVPLLNLLVDKTRLTIRFDLPLLRKVRGFDSPATGMTGKISRAGIKMRWPGFQGEYGRPNPFMKRGCGSVAKAGKGSENLKCTGYRLAVIEDPAREAENVNVLVADEVKWIIKLPAISEVNGFVLNKAKKTKIGFEIWVEYGSRYHYDKYFSFVCKENRFYLNGIRVESFDKANLDKHKERNIKIDPVVDLDNFRISDFLVE